MRWSVFSKRLAKWISTGQYILSIDHAGARAIRQSIFGGARAHGFSPWSLHCSELARIVSSRTKSTAAITADVKLSGIGHDFSFTARVCCWHLVLATRTVHTRSPLLSHQPLRQFYETRDVYTWVTHVDRRHGSFRAGQRGRNIRLNSIHESIGFDWSSMSLIKSSTK